MRAHAVKSALEKLGEVTVCVRPRTPVISWLGTHLPSVFQLFGASASDWPLKQPSKVVGDFTRVHIFRMSMISWAQPFFGKVDCDLDLDEIESRTRLNLSALHRQDGERLTSWRLAREAAFYEVKEQECLSAFRRIYVASAVEKQNLRSRFQNLPVVVLPNTVELAPHSPPRKQFPFRLLFVGNLNYSPNNDAVRFLAEELVPLLSQSNFEIWIVGRGLKSKLPDHPSLKLLGYVEDLRRLYSQVNAAIVPIRAGGGTRIKILDAMSHGLPVISTAVGMEGLALEPGRDVLVAENAQDFAFACEQLRADLELCEMLGSNGRRVVSENYTPDNLLALVQ
jgi:glycosyltransferase involved in cell wall biosynthesis